MFTKTRMPAKDDALPGRQEKMPVPEAHFVNGARLQPPFPDGLEQAIFGLGCFWGAERKFWQLPGVYTTAVGYSAGYTPNPTYREVCTGMTGHNEVVLVVFDPKKVSLRDAAEDVLGEPRSDPGHAPGQRRRDPVPVRHLLLRRRAARGRRTVARGVPGTAQKRRLRADHDGDHAGRRVLLRRGLPPAVSGQESWRLLRIGRDGSELSGRVRSASDRPQDSWTRTRSVGPAPKDTIS